MPDVLICGLLLAYCKSTSTDIEEVPEAVGFGRDCIAKQDYVKW